MIFYLKDYRSIPIEYKSCPFCVKKLKCIETKELSIDYKSSQSVFKCPNCSYMIVFDSSSFGKCIYEIYYNNNKYELYISKLSPYLMITSPMNSRIKTCSIWTSSFSHEFLTLPTRKLRAIYNYQVRKRNELRI